MNKITGRLTIVSMQLSIIFDIDDKYGFVATTHFIYPGGDNSFAQIRSAYLRAVALNFSRSPTKSPGESD